MTTPLAAVKDKFGDKAKLVAAVEALTKGDDLWVSRVNENKGLAHVSNAKLLRLLAHGRPGCIPSLRQRRRRRPDEQQTR